MVRFATIAVLALAVSCSPGAFTELQDCAPGDSRSQPDPSSGEPSNDFPARLASVPSAAGMRFVAAGQNPPSLSTFFYDRDGDLSAASLALEGPNAGIDQMVGGEDDLVAIARGGVIEIFNAGNGDNPPSRIGEPITTSICPGGPMAGGVKPMVLARTNVAGQSGTVEDSVDLIVGAGRRLFVFPDVGNSTPACFACTLDIGGPRMFEVNGLAAFEHETGDVGDEIIVTLEDVTSPSDDQARVEIFLAQQIRDDSGANCFSTSFSGFDIGNSRFGGAIAVGDFDGDDIDDAAFSAGPPQAGEQDVDREILVVTGLGGAANTPAITQITEPANDAEFGATLVAGDIDGTEGDRDELLVGDPLFGGSGAVAVFSIVPPNALPLGTVTDSDPSDGQKFGRSLAIGKMPGPGAETDDLVIVGTEIDVFTYFALFMANDPRGCGPEFP